MKNKLYPCDTGNYDCPFGAEHSKDCERYCGLGRDEDRHDNECDYGDEDY